MATAATTSNSTGTVTALASQPAAFARWGQERASLVTELATAKDTFATHTGMNEWNSYLASAECADMMRSLTMPFITISDRLVKHWEGGFFEKRRIAKLLTKSFVAKTRVDIFFPMGPSPHNGADLEGVLIRSVNKRVEAPDWQFGGYEKDKRIPRHKPVFIISWNDVSPWSIVIPGTGFIQPNLFSYTDEHGRKWNADNVISESYLHSFRLEFMQNYLVQVQSAYDKMMSYYVAQATVGSLERKIQKLDGKVCAWKKISVPTKTMNEILRRTELFEMGDAAAPTGLLFDGPSGTGKTTIAECLAESMRCNFVKVSLADVKQRELGASSQKVRALWNQARQKQPSVLFFDECEGVFGRRGAAETDVVADEIVKTILAEWNGNRSRILVIGATNRPDMIDDAILSRFDCRLTIGLPERSEREAILSRELQALNCTCDIPAEMGELTQGMSGRDLRYLAKDVRSLAHPDLPTDEHFFQAVRAKRKANNVKVDARATWETLAVGLKTLNDLKLICQLLRNAESWREKGIEVPQSLLLYGPPATGKTQIGRTLANESGLSFLMATTADLKANFLGQSGNRVKLLFDRARGQAPAILFIDELDIVAHKRGGSNDPMAEEIVGQLLQEMDGIQQRDSQVFVVAATNAPDAVDPAVVSRFLKKILVPLPDHQGRAKLLSTVLEKKKLSFDLATVVEELASRTEGKNHRDLLALIGAAEEKALMRAIANGGPEHFSLSQEDFN